MKGLPELRIDTHPALFEKACQPFYNRLPFKRLFVKVGNPYAFTGRIIENTPSLNSTKNQLFFIHLTPVIDS